MTSESMNVSLGLLSLACPLNYGSPNHSRTLGSGDDKEECNARQFNRTTGKVCILTKYMGIIRETVTIPTDTENDGEISLDDDNSDDKNEDSDDNNNGETQNGEDCDDKVVTHDLSGESSSVRINSNNTLPDENTKLERVSGFVASGKHTGDHIEEGSTSVTGVNDKNKNKPLGVSDSDSSESKVRDVVKDHKKSWIKRLCLENKVNFLGVQETMIGNLNRTCIQSFWNNSPFKFVCKKSNGRSGGILAVWDTNNFTMTDSLEGEGFLAILGNWRNIDQPCLMVVVYAPQDYREKKTLWNNLARLVDSHNNFSILIGYFNEVRFESERMGTEFDPRGAYEFNDFIHSSGLIDMPLVGKRFTRMDNLGSKHSKIDRFLVSHHVINKWPTSHVIALPREFSDHTPLILLNTTHDFGPIPFRLYNSWMDHPKFADPIQASWASSFIGLQPGVGFKCKLHNLKSNIKQWRLHVNHSERMLYQELRNKIDCLDNKAEVSLLTPVKVETRTSSIKFLADMENRKVKDLKQKAKIKWALEDFEVSAHIPSGCNSSFITLVPKVDDPLVIGDFRPISLIGSQYKIIAKILANRLSQVVSSVVSEVQVTYIKVRQIIDDHLMVDEIIAWAKKHKNRLMFFKVEFEKAFDSLNWSFLFSILEQIGFSFKWRNWIHSCLNSAFSSVLVNGSPTKEFKIKRGLRQGDPLLPFLFILSIESLNIALLEATNNNIFHGIQVGKDKIHVSHLQFADDALIIGD
ncbi:RNA-directed DNA polymerase, eukaryota [Tanacetum coccineum]